MDEDDRGDSETRGGNRIDERNDSNNSGSEKLLLPRHNRNFHLDDVKVYGNFVGWRGIGGSLGLVDREREISFAYCMNGAELNLLGGGPDPEDTRGVARFNGGVSDTRTE